MNRERRVEAALARRRARCADLNLDPEALDRLSRAKEALGLPQPTTERNHS